MLNAFTTDLDPTNFFTFFHPYSISRSLTPCSHHSLDMDFLNLVKYRSVLVILIEYESLNLYCKEMCLFGSYHFRSNPLFDKSTHVYSQLLDKRCG